MKKILSSLISLVVAVGAFAQTETTTIPIPQLSRQTNLYNGGTRLYAFTVDLTGMASATTVSNVAFELRDSPKSNIPRSGTATDNILEYTNSGYTSYATYVSNMNYLAAGSKLMQGVNVYTNYAGVVTTITNSSALSNYTFTTAVTVDGFVALRPVKVSGIANSNVITRFEFPSGIWFGRGITITNKTGAAAFLDGAKVTLEHTPNL